MLARMIEIFDKPFTQQEPLPDAAIARVTELLQNGRLHRYNIAGDEVPESTLLEEDYAAYQGAKYCVAVTSGGQAMQISMRAAGLKPGDKVLTNAYTLAPVPGAIHAVGGVPVLVEIERNWHIDLDHLEVQAKASGATFMMLSLMRGHIPDMARITDICARYGITLIEDCAHTMGASWQGTKSGNFGKAACFSTQTYKHINSGEGGLITTDDPELAARAVITSGSYMLYEAHGARPDDAVFERIKLDAPNCSARLDNARAAMIRAQLPTLDHNVARWNDRYNVLAKGLSAINGLDVPERAQHEAFVGSSIQFHATALGPERIPDFVTAAAARGIDIKWFGAAAPKAFTSRYDSWEYLGPAPDLKQTKDVLSTTCDMRVPLTFSTDDCTKIARILDDIHSEMT
jgi:dTDP-4-amino-4,6-dideoxygalactose transaminase